MIELNNIKNQSHLHPRTFRKLVERYKIPNKNDY